MTEIKFDPKELIASLVKSPHGDLNEYRAITFDAVQASGDFYAHLIAWNAVKGQVRDSKVALPVGALQMKDQPTEHLENALALLVTLPNRDFVRALSLSKEWGTHSRNLRRLVTRKLRDLEASRGNWERVAIQHRDTLRRLYALYHIAPGGAKGSFEDVALMKGQATTGKFAVVRDLPHLPALQLGALVKQHKLPFLVVRGALGPRAKEQDVALALIESMSPNEIVINTRALVRLGIKTDPVLRAAYEKRLAEVGTTKRSKRGTSTLRTTKIAEVIEKDDLDESLATKLKAAQERQIQQLGTIDGNWLVLGDRSPSMHEAIDVAMQICALLTRLVAGKVHLVLFDAQPRYYDVTGKSYDELRALLKNMQLGSATSCGVGLDYIVDRNIQVDGIAIVSDGGHNTAPDFSTAYRKYEKKFDTQPTVYFYELQGDADRLSAELQRAQIQCEKFALRGQSIDHYSLPNLVSTMRVSRYSLTDEIYATPLVTLDDVLTRTKGVEVVKREEVTA